MTIPKHIEIARTYLGLKEIRGPVNNAKIVRMFSLAGHPEIKADEVPWCAAFVAACLAEAGMVNEVSSSLRLWAAAYSKLGTALKEPVYGCVGVKTRNGGGHVGFVVAANKSRVWLLGGNQGDSVSVASFPRAGFTAFRLPAGVNVKGLPKLPLAAAGALNPSQA